MSKHKIFEGATWFHFTGITPALGGDLPEICLEACKAAKKRGITISCDLNYRKKLWTREEANRCMSQLVPYVDVCIANEEDAADVFGIKALNTDVSSGKLDQESYVDVARQITERFGCRSVAITLRGSISANDNDWAGMLYTGGKAYVSPTYRVHIVDRVGGGDSFGGALIYSQLMGYTPQDSINYVFLLIMNIFLLFIGMILDSSASLVVLVPILAPIAAQYGVNLIHFGVIFCLNIMIGLLTPPVGTSLYLMSTVMHKSFKEVVHAISPWLIPLFIALFVCTYWEGFVLFVPRLFGMA